MFFTQPPCIVAPIGESENMDDALKRMRKLPSGDEAERGELERLGYVFTDISKTGAQIFILSDPSSVEQQTVEAIETTFGLERDLQNALRANIEQLEEGLKISDGGKEQIVPSGRIDITAEDQRGARVIIELKAGTADRDAVGQVLSYKGQSEES
jgi:hypothetical protein